MDLIERIVNSLFRRKKRLSTTNSDYEFITQRQMETMASSSSGNITNTELSDTQQSALHSAGLVPPAVPSIPIKGGPAEAAEAAAASPYDNEAIKANQIDSRHAGGGYSDVSPAELTPIEGHPGQFTNGGGKGAQDPDTGNSFGTYPVYDGNGKFLGENATVVISGVTTNYGFSYGSPIPSDIADGTIDLSTKIMNQEEALQSAGLNGEASAQNQSQPLSIQSEASHPTSAAAPAASENPSGSTYIVGGEVINPSVPAASQIQSVPAHEEVPTANELSRNEPSASPPIMSGPAEAAEAAAASPYDQEVITANELNRSRPTNNSLAGQRLADGRSQRLDPDGNMSGGANFDIAGPSENPVDSFGGASGDHQAV